MTGCIGAFDLFDKIAISAGFHGYLRQQVVVHFRAGPVSHHDPCGELGDLTRHPDEEAVFQFVLDGPLYGLTGEVPDLYEVHLFQVRQEAHGGLLGEAPGREDEGLVILRAHDAQGLNHARGPGCGGEGAHDARGTEDGDAADDAEAGVGRLFGHLFAAWDAYYDPDAALLRIEDFLYGVGDHTPRHGVYGWSSDWEPEPRFGDDANAITPVQLEPLLFPPRDAGGEMGAVGDVGVVAGVLDYDGLGP